MEPAARGGEARRSGGRCDGDSTPKLASRPRIAGLLPSGDDRSVTADLVSCGTLAAMPRRLLVLLCLAALAGCGGGGSAGGSPPPTLSQARQELTGAPPALAGIHQQASRVLPGGPAALRARLRALRGHPVVVNQWGSWCGPCRYEFPVLQRVSAKLGRRVAFLGALFRDDSRAARRFLARHPLSYPSYADRGQALARALGNPAAAPITNFYDARGKLVYQHAGPYQNDGQLERDLRKYTRGT